MAEKQTRTDRMAAHRERIASCEKLYEASIASTHEVLTEILRNPKHAAAQARVISQQLTATFMDDQGATIMVVSSRKVDEISHQHALKVMILTMIIGKGLGLPRELMDVAGVGATLARPRSARRCCATRTATAARRRFTACTASTASRLWASMCRLTCAR